eukprot:SAG31_NODE_788_length_12088_cov_3.916090_10_plen_1025_part_00
MEGAEGGGGRGFFTMNHEVVDASSQLDNLLLGQVDRQCNVAWLHGKCLPLLARHVQEVCESLDSMGPSQRMEMLEEDLSEPLTSYYEYGLLRERSTGNAGRGASWGAELKVGVHSSSVCRKGGTLAAEPNAEDATPMALSGCGVLGRTPSHFVLAVGQPRGPLYVARTYFLHSGHEIADYKTEERLVGADDSFEGDVKILRANADENEGADALMLRKLYVSIVRATHQALQSFGNNDLDLEAEAVQGAVFVSINAALTQTRELPDDFVPEDNLEVDVVAVDSKGKTASEWESPQSAASLVSYLTRPSVRVVRAILRNVPSKEVSGQVAGAIVFADTFMMPKGGLEHVGVRIVTASIPYLSIWLGQREDILAEQMRRAMLDNEKSVTADMGRAVVANDPASGQISLDPATIWVAGVNDYLQAYAGTLHAYERGWSFDHPRLGPMSFMFRGNTVGISIFESSSPARPSLITIHLSRALKIYGFSRMSSAPLYCISIVIGGGLQKRWFRDVVPLWLGLWEGCGLKVETAQGPLPCFEALYQHSCMDRDRAHMDSCELEMLNRTLVGSPTGDMSFYMNKSSLRQFCAAEPVRSTDSTTESKHNAEQKIPLTIVCGVPGSGHHLVAKSVVSYSRAVSWEMVTQNETDNADTMSSLQQAAEAASAKRGTSEDVGSTRVLLVTSGYADIVRLAADIINTEAVHSKCTIAAILTVVNPANVSVDRHGTVMPKFASNDKESFTETTQAIPLLLDQCVWGWASVIILLGGSTIAQNMLQGRIEKVNPDATIARGAYAPQWTSIEDGAKRARVVNASLGMLSPSELEAVTSTDTFCSDKLTRVRAVVDSSWPQSRSSPSVTRSPDRVAFRLPSSLIIDRFRLVDNLRPLFQKPINSGRLLFASVKAVTLDSSAAAVLMTFTSQQEDVEKVDACASGAGVAIFYGENIDVCAGQLEALILHSRPPLEQPTSVLASPNDLTDEQRAEIQSRAQAEESLGQLPGNLLFVTFSFKFHLILLPPQRAGSTTDVTTLTVTD